MSNILTFDQFKEGYVFEKKTIYRENIESLEYLSNRYQYETMNEGVADTLDSWANDISGFFKQVFEIDFDKVSWEDWAHFAADIGGAVGDLIYPGVGVTIDVIHSLVYFYQGWTETDEEKKGEKFLLGLMTLLFAHPALNPLQGIFGFIKKPIAKVVGLLKKLRPGQIPRPDQIAAVKKVLEGEPQATKFLEKAGDVADEASQSLMRRVNDYTPDDAINLTRWQRFKGSCKKILDAILWPIRAIKRYVLEPIGLGGLYRGGAMVAKLPFKVIYFLAENSLKPLFKMVSRNVYGFPERKTIKMFDSMFSSLSSNQRNLVKVFRDEWDGITALSGTEIFKLADDTIVMSFKRGATSCKCIRRGAGATGQELTELTTFWEKHFDDLVARGKIIAEDPNLVSAGTRGIRREATTSTGAGFMPGTTVVTPEITSAEVKRNFVQHMVNSTRIVDVQKTAFLKKSYKTLEDKIATNTAWKFLAAPIKFMLSVVGTAPSDDNAVKVDDSSGGGGADNTLSDEQLEELENNINQGDEDFPHDLYEQGMQQLTPEEREQTISTIAETEPDFQETVGITTVYEALWISLSDVYPDIKIPEESESIQPGYWIKKFQEDNRIKSEGKINTQTLELLINETKNDQAREYLKAYLVSLLSEEKSEEEKKSKDSKPQTQKEEGEESKGGSKVKRRLKKFGRFLSGEE